MDLRRSTACFHKRKWSKFFQWCRGRNIAPCKATVQQIAEFFLYLRKELKLLVLAIRTYKATLSHVCSLKNLDLTANSHQEDVQQLRDLSSKVDQTTRMGSVFGT